MITAKRQSTRNLVRCLAIAGALALPAGALGAPFQNDGAEDAPGADAGVGPEAADATPEASEATAADAVTPAPEAAEVTAAATAGDDEREWYFDFDALEQYRFRYATAPTIEPTVSEFGGTGEAPGSETDHDLRILVSGTLSESADHFVADAAMGLWADLDGNYPQGNYSGFASPYDESQVYGLPMWIDLYSLYAEYHSRGLFALGRLGRQVSEHGPLVTFDGAAVELALSRKYLDVFAFGGRSVHFFELDNKFSENWMASGGFEIRPLRQLRLELDYRFTKDTVTPVDADAAVPEVIDHTYGVAAWYRGGDWLYLKGYFRGINDTAGLAGGAATAEWTAPEIGLDLKADAQLVTLREINERHDPFYAVLGESLPHVRVNADLWKAFTTEIGTYTLHGGWGGRFLTADAATQFNRDYGRAYLWFQATDIGVVGPFAGVIGEFHYTHMTSELSETGEENDENMFSIGGSAGFDREPLRVELGTFYQRFKYDYYVEVKEIESVRTYFGEVSYRPLDWLSAGLRYEFEQYDRQVHSVTLTLTQRY